MGPGPTVVCLGVAGPRGTGGPTRQQSPHRLIVIVDFAAGRPTERGASRAQSPASPRRAAARLTRAVGERARRSLARTGYPDPGVKTPLPGRTTVMSTNDEMIGRQGVDDLEAILTIGNTDLTEGTH